MQTTTLGRTGLAVSVAGLGCGGYSKLGLARGGSGADAVRLVRAALDHGITLIDTAAAYGTEEIVGEAIRERRDDVVLSTKVPIYAGDFHDVDRVIDASQLEHELDGCLRRLGVEYVDILHLHAVVASQYDHVRAELLPRLDDLRRKGKLRFVGLSERFVADTTHEMACLAAEDGLVDVLMIGLNYVNQTAVSSVLQATATRGIGTLCMFAVRGPLATRAGVTQLVEALVERGEVDVSAVDLADPVGFLVAPGVADSLTEAAYRFCRHAPGVDVTITGTGSVDHLLDNISALRKGPLPAEVLSRLAAIFGNVTSASAEP